MKSKKMLFINSLLFTSVITPTCNALISNTVHKNVKISKSYTPTKEQLYIPFFNFKDINNEFIDSINISSITLDDILSIPYNQIFSKNVEDKSQPLELFSFNDPSMINDTKPTALINIFVEDYSIYKGIENNQEKYNLFIKNYIDDIELIKYPTIGTVRVNMKLKNDKNIRFISIDDKFDLEKNLNVINDNFSFSIVNFKTSKEVVVESEMIDISNTKLSYFKANEIKTDDLVNNLFQFADTKIIDNPLLVTNYTHQDFIKIFDINYKILSTDKFGMRTKALLEITPKKTTRKLQSYPGGKYIFNMKGFKTDFYIRQISGTVDISSSKELKQMKATEFKNKNSNISLTQTYKKFLNRYINFSDVPPSENSFIDTNLSTTEFYDENYIDPRIVIEDSNCNDIEGIISNAKLIVKIPLNLSGDIYEEQIFTFNIVGFKIDVNINLNDSNEVLINKELCNIKVKDVDEEFILENLVKYNVVNNDLDLSNFIFSTNTNKLNIEEFAIEEIKINSKDEIKGYVVVSIKFTNLITLNRENDSNIFTFKVSGFKKDINIYYEDNSISIGNKENLNKYKFLSDQNGIFKSIDNIQQINNYLSKKENIDKILKDIFIFEYNGVQNNRIFSTNADISFISSLISSAIALEDKTLGIVTIRISFINNVNGVFINGIENNEFIEFKIVDYPKEFYSSINNIKNINVKNFPELSNFNNLTEDDILNSTLFEFLSITKTNTIISTDLTLEIFKKNFLKSISLFKEKELGLIHVVIKLYNGFIKDVNEIFFTIYDYFSIDNQFIFTNNIENITDISEYREYKPSMFNINDVYNFINYKNDNKKFNLLKVNCHKVVFENVLLNNISLSKSDDSIQVKFDMNEKGVNKTFESNIYGFNSDKNWTLIIVLSICIPIIVIFFVILIIYLIKRNKIKKEIENE